MLVIICRTPEAMTTLCSAVFPRSALHAILDSLHLALVPTELKAVIQTQLPQKTSVHWASKRSAGPLTFSSYKAEWQHLLPLAMCTADGSNGKGILYAERFINMRIHVCWLVTKQSVSPAVNWVAEDKTSVFKCCFSYWSLVGLFSLIFTEEEVSTFCWLTVSAEARPPSLLRNSADSLMWGRRTVQVQKEAIETAKFRVERLIEHFYSAVILCPVYTTTLWERDVFWSQHG